MVPVHPVYHLLDPDIHASFLVLVDLLPRLHLVQQFLVVFYADNCPQHLRPQVAAVLYLVTQFNRRLVPKPLHLLLSFDPQPILRLL